MKKILISLGILLIVLLAVYITIYKSKEVQKLNLEKIKNSQSLTDSQKFLIENYGFNFKLSEEQEKVLNINCDGQNVSTSSNKDNWFICQNENKNQYVGLFWKKASFKKMSFQQNFANDMMRVSNHKDGTFTCEEMDRKDKNKMGGVFSKCIIQDLKTKEKMSFYLYFFYPNLSPDISNVLVVADMTWGKDKDTKYDELFYSLTDKLKRPNQDFYSMENKNTENDFIALASGGAGKGDGSAKGSDICSKDGNTNVNNSSRTCGAGQGGTSSGNSSSRGNDYGGNGNDSITSCRAGSHFDYTILACAPDIITLNCDYGTLSWNYNEPAKSCITCQKIKTQSQVVPADCRWRFFGRVCTPETTTPATYYTAATQAQCPNTPPEVFVR